MAVAGERPLVDAERPVDGAAFGLAQHERIDLGRDVIDLHLVEAGAVGLTECRRRNLRLRRLDLDRVVAVGREREVADRDDRAAASEALVTVASTSPNWSSRLTVDPSELRRRRRQHAACARVDRDRHRLAGAAEESPVVLFADVDHVRWTGGVFLAPDGARRRAPACTVPLKMAPGSDLLAANIEVQTVQIERGAAGNDQLVGVDGLARAADELEVGVRAQADRAVGQIVQESLETSPGRWKEPATAAGDCRLPDCHRNSPSLRGKEPVLVVLPLTFPVMLSVAVGSSDRNPEPSISSEP